MAANCRRSITRRRTLCRVDRGGRRNQDPQSRDRGLSRQQRDPIQTAKLVASLDQIAGGRFLFGGGSGWNAEEMADHGTEFRTRFKLMRERIEAMKEVWTKDKAEYHGEMVDFPEMMASPKPVQKTVSSDPRWRRFPARRTPSGPLR